MWKLIVRHTIAIWISPKMGGTPQNLNVCWESNEFPNHRRNVGFLSSSWDALFRFVDAAMRYVTEINERCGSKLSLEPQRTGDIFVMGWIRFFWFHMLFLWLGDDSIPFLVSDFRQLKPSLLEPSDWSSRWAADAASDRGWNTLSSKLSRSFELQVPLSNEDLMTPTAWWFGTFGLFFHILGIVCPTDFHIFQKGWNHQPAKSWWRHGGHGVFDQRSPRGPLVSGIRWVHPSGPRGARYKPGSRLKDAPLFLDHMQQIQKVGAIRGVCNTMGRQEGESWGIG